MPRLFLWGNKKVMKKKRKNVLLVVKKGTKKLDVPICSNMNPYFYHLFTNFLLRDPATTQCSLTRRQVDR